MSEILIRIIYVLVFAGCYLFFVKELLKKEFLVLEISTLFIGLLLLYHPMESNLFTVTLRYAAFQCFYIIWSLLFLHCHKTYAIYLSLFYTLFMGICFSVIQVFFLLLNFHSNTTLTLYAGLLRVIAIIILKTNFIKIDSHRTITIRETILGLFPSAACFVANIVFFDYLLMAKFPKTHITFAYILVIFFAIAAMLVLVTSENYFTFSRYKSENLLAQQQLHDQYSLFLKEKENREHIQSMYHDMKNHLLTIEQLSHNSQAKQYIKEIHDSINNLEPPFNTGCLTLDALLMNKKVDCDINQIKLTCYVHLSDFNFLSSMEICAIFGNCIDNAIEAVSTLPLKERYIHITGGKINQSILIKIINPYNHSLIRDSNQFITTKQDKTTHGYGLKNIQHIIDNHDGILTFNTDNNIFTVCWMIPIPKN